MSVCLSVLPWMYVASNSITDNGYIYKQNLWVKLGTLTRDRTTTGIGDPALCELHVSLTRWVAFGKRCPQGYMVGRKDSLATVGDPCKWRKPRTKTLILKDRRFRNRLVNVKMLQSLKIQEDQEEDGYMT
jgi:hypothetical protein